MSVDAVSVDGSSIRTATICEAELIKPIAPNTRPISELRPMFCSVTAPSDWSAGYPPDVMEFREVRKMKSAWFEVGDITTRALAVASVKYEIAVTARSNTIACERLRSVALLLDGRFGAKKARTAIACKPLG